MKIRTLTIIFLLIARLSGAQTQGALDSLFILPDTITTFSIENLYASMLEHHPIVKQTRLLGEMAQQEVRLARGAFDPKLESRLNLKEFDNKEYYIAEDNSDYTEDDEMIYEYLNNCCHV